MEYIELKFNDFRKIMEHAYRGGLDKKFFDKSYKKVIERDDNKIKMKRRRLK